MCEACGQHDQTIFSANDSAAPEPLARAVLEKMFHFPDVLIAAEETDSEERETLTAMIFTALGIVAWPDEPMEMVEERTVLADGAIAKSYFFPATGSRLAIARNSKQGVWVLDFSFGSPASSRRQMSQFDSWIRGL